MSRQKLIPPLAETSESEYERFKRFAASVLTIPRSKVTPEQAPLRKTQIREDGKGAETKVKGSLVVSTIPIPKEAYPDSSGKQLRASK